MDSDEPANTTCPNVLKISPCSHLFHTNCIITWLNGTTLNRNACPTCNTPLCRLSVLSTFYEAHRIAETWHIPKTTSNINEVTTHFKNTDLEVIIEYK